MNGGKEFRGGPPVVVLGADCPTGLQAARIFAERGVGVIGIADDPTHPCARTRAYRRILQAPQREDGCLEALLRLIAELPEGAVLLPCTDLSVLEVSRHRSALGGTYRMALPAPEILELLLDKARFARFTAENGFPTPRTRVLRSPDDAMEASREFEFPCVLKPSVKTGTWRRHAPAKVLVAESPSSLVGLYERCSPWCDSLVVQEWIEGGDADHYTCNCYFDSTGEPLVTFCTRKLRQWPPHVGQGCLSVEHRNEIVRETTLELFRTAGHRGLGYLEMKWDAATGRHLIIEANVGRPTGRSATCEAAGVELLMTSYCDLLGIPLPKAREQQFRGTKWIHLRRDLQASARLLWIREESIRGIVRSWRGRRTFALWSWRDPVPFLADLTRPLHGKPSRGIRFPQRADEAVDQPVANPGRADEGVDFLVANLVRVRVHGAGPADLRAVSRELGLPEASPEGDPDITVRFDTPVASKELRLLDGGTAAYGRDGFYLLGSPAGPVRAKLRADEEWGRGRITCRRGLSRVPLLTEMVDLAAIARGWIPLHASAWAVGGTGILAAGWARSGKTGAMLSFAVSGARLLGDDRVFLSADGRRMVGVPGSVHLRDWHLAQLPALANAIGAGARRSARLGAMIERLADRAARRAGGADSRWRRGILRGCERLRRRMGVELPLSGIAPEQGTEPASTSADLLILLESHDQDAITCEPLDPRTLARRITAMVQSDLMTTLRTPLSIRYAFGEGWAGVERAPDRVAEMVHQATQHRTGYLVRHPYPCSLNELEARIRMLLPGAADARPDPTGSENRRATPEPPRPSTVPPTRSRR